jgi:hypothetical protein
MLAIGPRKRSFCFKFKIRNFQTTYLSSMQITANIPEYFNVKHYKDFSILKSLDEMEQRLHVITALTGESMETVKQWPIPFVIQLYAKLNELISSVQPEFYPVIEWEGKQYGFRPMHKMSLDEYIDFENLAKDTDKNINQILAIIYRPITKNKLDKGTFVAKSTFKVLKNEIENGFDYYEIEKYDNEVRKERAPLYDNFPASVALGAMGFFLDSKLSLLNSTVFYFPQWELMMSELKKKKSKIKRALARITAGYISSTNLAKVPSYKSLDISV